MLDKFHRGLERFIDIARNSLLWAKNIFAWGVSILVLFYLPSIVAGWAWDNQMRAGNGISEAIAWIFLVFTLWYIFLVVVMRPLWYQSWANLVVLYETITGKPIMIRTRDQ